MLLLLAVVAFDCLADLLLHPVLICCGVQRLVGTLLSRQNLRMAENWPYAADLCSCPSHGLGLAFLFLVFFCFRTSVFVLLWRFALKFW